jgi:poly(3-hydroxybutyrate) depolymerase
VTHKRWNQCAGGAVFEYWEIEGGGHTWPGHGRPAPDKSRDVNATVEMLRFFRENGGL